MSERAWLAQLDYNDKGLLRSTLANAVSVLQFDPSWGPNILWYDEFLDRALTREGDTIREWRDDDDTRLTVYMQQEIGLRSIPEAQVSSAVRYVSRQRMRHCVREWVALTPWDRVERIAHAFEDFWGVESSANQPSDYIRAVSANFFLGMIARIMKPGCQLDTMVVFEGAQGIGKSRALRVIGGEWYMLAAESVTTKDFYQTLPGKLLAEIGEMDSFSRAERERIKLAISTPTDRYRSSYGRRAADHPRQCSFAGTTNHDDYGNDDTGLRRFLPVRCGVIDIPGLTAARAQLFAEAAYRIAAGEPWWETPSAPTLAAQRDRQYEDIWTSLVLDYLVGKAEVHLPDVLRDACKVNESQMTHTHKIRLGSILRLAGWSKSNRRREGRQVKTWVAPEDE